MTREERLKDFLVNSGEGAVTWGKDDCSMWPAAWVGQEIGKVLDTPTVHSEQEARQYLIDEGGIQAVWDRILEDAGVFQGYGGPKTGDVGLIATNAFGTIGGIFIHNAVIIRAKIGFSYLPIRNKTLLKHWTVPEC